MYNLYMKECKLIENWKQWDSVYLRQGTSYQCRESRYQSRHLAKMYFNLGKRIHLNKICRLLVSSSLIITTAAIWRISMNE